MLQDKAARVLRVREEEASEGKGRGEDAVLGRQIKGDVATAASWAQSLVLYMFNGGIDIIVNRCEPIALQIQL